MTKASAPLIAAVGLTLVVSACGIVEPQVCHDGILYDVTPDEVTLTVGESFEPAATIVTCPEGRRELQLDWSAEDPSLVNVNPETGETTGVEPGSTRVLGSEEQGAPVLDVDVTVVD